VRTCPTTLRYNSSVFKATNHSEREREGGGREREREKAKEITDTFAEI